MDLEWLAPGGRLEGNKLLFACEGIIQLGGFSLTLGGGILLSLELLLLLLLKALGTDIDSCCSSAGKLLIDFSFSLSAILFSSSDFSRN
jgi:hypothetical protein